jgi:hypothetical protein
MAAAAATTAAETYTSNEEFIADANATSEPVTTAEAPPVETSNDTAVDNIKDEEEII